MYREQKLCTTQGVKIKVSRIIPNGERIQLETFVEATPDIEENEIPNTVDLLMAILRRCCVGVKQ